MISKESPDSQIKYSNRTPYNKRKLIMARNKQKPEGSSALHGHYARNEDTTSHCNLSRSRFSRRCLRLCDTRRLASGLDLRRASRLGLADWTGFRPGFRFRSRLLSLTHDSLNQNKEDGPHIRTTANYDENSGCSLSLQLPSVSSSS